MKIVTRDASLRQEHQHEIDSVLRDVERWISEAKTAVDISDGNLGWEGLEWDDSSVNSAQATKERLALEALCENLTEKGALVPLSKKSVPVRALSKELRANAIVTVQEANTGREIVSPLQGGGLVMDAVDKPYRVIARRIHNNPGHATRLAITQRTRCTGTGNAFGARQFLRLIYRRVGYIPVGHPNLIVGRRRRGPSGDGQRQYHHDSHERPGTARAQHLVGAKNVSSLPVFDRAICPPTVRSWD